MRLLLIAALLVVAALILGFQQNVDKIPNGEVNSCDTCHTNGGGSPRNDFGLAFFGNGQVWDSGLAGEDSDGGGVDNGDELLDPDGTWNQGDADPGDPDNVLNPGDETDDEEFDLAPASWGGMKLLLNE